MRVDDPSDSNLLLNELLDRALALPIEQREQWLDQLDPSHARVLPRLRDLLARCEDAAMDRFLSTLPRMAAPGNLPFELPRTHAGPYRLLERIGSGGMGSVWLAERTDGGIKRRVALKLPQGSWSRQELAERLFRERDILAVLKHRHIARLYDAGITRDGQPYLAFEYVDGKPIDGGIVRYLASQPVSAQRDTARFRFIKFLSRNRFASVTAALLALTLAATFVIAIDVAQGVVADQAEVIETKFTLPERRLDATRSAVRSGTTLAPLF